MVHRRVDRLDEMTEQLKDLGSKIISMTIGGQGYDELISQI
ncbi:hypothetical protein SALIVB_1414 [Streptococcus salivarius CCHSS3]|nr:hypothetical protein Ssal_01494 [Streptococcus salivarius 57.I]CCB93692.1 hypothetical protein SALIVB_1414 [Streptococcus salivarius CCHSS3]